MGQYQFLCALKMRYSVVDGQEEFRTKALSPAILEIIAQRSTQRAARCTRLPNLRRNSYIGATRCIGTRERSTQR